MPTESKHYYVGNVRKAAEYELRQADPENPGITLRLINGMHGGLVKERRYRTVAGLLRNGRKVVACFRFYPSSASCTGTARSTRIQFEATW